MANQGEEGTSCVMCVVWFVCVCGVHGVVCMRGMCCRCVCAMCVLWVYVVCVCVFGLGCLYVVCVWYIWCGVCICSVCAQYVCSMCICVYGVGVRYYLVNLKQASRKGYGKRVAVGRSLVGKRWVWSGEGQHRGGGQQEGETALPVVLPTLSYHPENHGLNFTHKCPCSVDSTGWTLWWHQTLVCCGG